MALCLISSLLLWMAWPPLPLAPVVFIGFVPLLIAEDNISRYHPRRWQRTVLLAYITFLCWNLLTTYWISFASLGGAELAIGLNSLLMTVPFLGYHLIKRRLGKRWGYVSLTLFWLCLEMLHLNWDAPWPWLNLGNSFAMMPNWVQWYEYTGALGGTIWVWVLNILIMELVRSANDLKKPKPEGRHARRILGMVVIAIALPVCISYIIKPKDDFTYSNANAVVVQPNIDPYNDKFDPATFTSQIKTLISLSEKTMDSNTVVVAWPETAIAEPVNEAQLNGYQSISEIHHFLKRHPRIKLITGANAFAMYAKGETPSNTARQFMDKSGWYDAYNAAFEMDATDSVYFYHKYKLVPGVEKMPYPGVLGFLAQFAISEGGTEGSLGSQFNPVPFKINDSLKIAPVICYESIFGDYVRDFVKNGANVLAVITNDGWWKNSPGYRQHLYFGALRAIETRRFIIRAANTGVSCFVLPTGEIVQPTEYWVPAAIKSRLIVSNSLTFYSRYGDYLGWGAVYLSYILIIIALYTFIARSIRGRKPKPGKEIS